MLFSRSRKNQAAPRTRVGIRGLTFATIVLAASCQYPATEVLIGLDTDAPVERALTITASVRVGSMVVGDAGTGNWVRGGPAPTTTLPGNFAVVPGMGGASDGRVTVVIDAELAPGNASDPIVRFRRVARFAFTPRTATTVPIFLSVSCGNRSTECTTVPADRCTLSVLCEERMQTCGDDGRCVTPDVVPAPLAPDAGPVADARPAVDTGPIADTGPVADAPTRCTSAGDCNDQRFCNGVESCQPGAAGADPRGCVQASAGPCVATQSCDETMARCVANCVDLDMDGSAAMSCGGTDCDDARAQTHPGAMEICNGIDDDCDSAIDDGVMTTFYRDGDNDGFGSSDPMHAMTACTRPARYATNNTDCNDNTPTVAPGVRERCDTVDNDCTGVADDARGVANGSCIYVGLSSSSQHVCTLRGDGQVFCWGNNSDGQLGDGTPVDHNVATLATMMPDADEVAVGGLHTCARRGGSVLCWGGNMFGQLGVAMPATSAVPLVVPGISTAVQLSLGLQSSCARLMNGQVSCWGVNTNGQLGDGTRVSRATPAPVMGLADAAEITSGGFWVCARRAGGTGSCWGQNLFGQLGDGTMTNALAPTPVSALTGALGIQAGNQHACAARSVGMNVCWGYNGYGQLGNNTMSNSPRPVTVMSGAANYAEIVGGSAHSCARVTTGALQCWGNNGSGQLGNGLMTTSLLPVNVIGFSAAQVVAAGDHTCARTTGGAGVSCWGFNSGGVIGNGSTASSFARPQPVMGL